MKLLCNSKNECLNDRCHWKIGCDCLGKENLTPFSFECDWIGKTVAITESASIFIDDHEVENISPGKITIRKKDEGVKFDSQKLRWDLLPFDALEEVVKVYTYGATKYDDRNWEKGIKYSRVYGALLRHLMAWVGGKIFNKEDGNVLHLSQVVWNALALLTYEVRGMREKCNDLIPRKVE